MLLAFTAAWGLPGTDGSSHVERLVPVRPSRVLDSVCVCVCFSFFLPPSCSLSIWVSYYSVLWAGNRSGHDFPVCSSYYLLSSITAESVVLMLWGAVDSKWKDGVSLIVSLSLSRSGFSELLLAWRSSAGCPGVSGRYFKMPAWAQPPPPLPVCSRELEDRSELLVGNHSNSRTSDLVCSVYRHQANTGFFWRFHFLQKFLLFANYGCQQISLNSQWFKDGGWIQSQNYKQTQYPQYEVESRPRSL